jgi:ribonuclease G
MKKMVITKMPIDAAIGSAVRTVSAVYEDGECLQLAVHDTSSILGNIYLGRVDNIVKNINSAFVSIESNTACYYSLGDNKQHYFFNPKNNNALNQGDAVLVQVKSDATKLKPATLTSKAELAGYYLVLSLDVNGVLVSRKIKDNERVKSLKEALETILEEKLSGEFANSKLHFGFIIRSNAALLENTEPALVEAQRMMEALTEIERKATYTKAPACIYRSAPDYFRMIDDIALSDFDSIITDDESIYSKIEERYGRIFAGFDIKIRLYRDECLALYNLYDVNKQIARAMARKIWLKSGGYIIIDYTEAMTVIDVNSGKYVTKKNDLQAKENAFYLVNREAAVEIAKQLRLRNISGMIIVDFINMNDDEHVQGIVKTLREEFKKDKVTTAYVDMTKLGLVEITRKREGAMLREYINSEVADEL